MKIASLALERTFQKHQMEYETAVLRATRSGWYVMGKELEAFETAFAAYLGVKHCIGLNSGLDALTLALRCLEIGVGDEVIVPANTYIATVLAVTENGASPVFVEPDAYMNLDPARIEAAITARTRMILPVHLYGQTCRMDQIVEISRRHGLLLVEDVAQSHGARFAGKRTGAFGDIGCFSFYPTKPLGAFGDGGAVVTDDDDLAEKLRMLRNYGSRVKYHNEMTGVNSRLDELQAAVLQVGLVHLDENNQERQKQAARYLEGIQNDQLTLPKIAPESEHVFHQFPVLCDTRDALQAFLMGQGIQTLVHYPIPPYRAACYEDLRLAPAAFPATERFAAEELSLPIYVGLTPSEQDYIIDCLNRYRI